MKALHPIAGLAVGLSLVFASPGRADCEFDLIGNATADLGVVSATSLAPTGFGGLEATLEDDVLFSELGTLRTEFNLTDDGAGGGSPRFQIALDTDDDGDADGNVFVYLGTPPNFNDPGTNTWLDSGELIAPGSLVERWDFSQFVAGAQSSTYDETLAALGGEEVVSVSLVVDGGWNEADGEQTVLFRNIQINGCDDDGDLVPDELDECPDSDLRPFVDFDDDTANGNTGVPNVVDADGCSIQDEVNKILDSNPRNHGQFVSAIAKLANAARKAGLLTAAESNALKNAAAQSNIGQSAGDDDDDDDDDDDNGGAGKNKNKNKNGKGNAGGNGKGKGKKK